MLVRNPLTTYLYEHGYNGIDNIYNYWLDHKKDILSSYKLKFKSAKSSFHDVDAFKYKVRWGSHRGMFIRLALDRLLRESKPGTQLGLKDMKAKIGRTLFTIDDFSQITMANDSVAPLIDLRGISIISKTFGKVVISDVDFSYAALDRCTFDQVTFINCRFYHTSFRHCILTNSTFDASCHVDGVDFSNIRFNGDMKCKVFKPKITSMNRSDYWRYKRERESRYIRYSKITSPSFIDNCEDEKIKQNLKTSLKRLSI